MLNIERDGRASKKQAICIACAFENQYSKLPAKIGTSYPGKIALFCKQIFVGSGLKNLATPRRP